jgi:hypothetical protein
MDPFGTLMIVLGILAICCFILFGVLSFTNPSIYIKRKNMSEEEFEKYFRAIVMGMR